MLAVSYQMYLYAVLIAAVILLSILYHMYDEHAWGNYDRAAAMMLIFTNFAVSYWAHFPEPYSMLAIVFVVIAFVFYFTDKQSSYELHHSAWHLSSAIITCLCIVAYASAL